MPINNAIIEGNLTADPEFKTTTSGAALCKFRIASNEKRPDGDDVTFIDITCWDSRNAQQGNGLASRMSKYLTRGDRVAVEGRLTYDEWEDQQSGQKRSKIYITANKVHFLRVKYFDNDGDTMGDHNAGSDQRGGGRGQNQGGGQQGQRSGGNQRPAPGGDGVDFDDIPF